MFCPDGKANRARIDFLFRQFLGVELRMGGASRMDNQRFHVRYVRQQGEYLQIIDKAVRFLLPAPYLEREDRSCSVREISLVKIVVRMIASAGWFTFFTFGWFFRNPTTLRALATWRSTRKESVSRPCSNINVLNGLIAAPVSRNNTARMRMA